MSLVCCNIRLLGPAIAHTNDPGLSFNSQFNLKHTEAIQQVAEIKEMVV